MADENHTVPGLMGGWDSAVLVPVAEINQHMLQIVRASADESAMASRPQPRLVSALSELWRALDPAALQRLANCPYLLLDAGFAAPERWDRLALDSGVMDGAASRGYFASPAGVALVRRTLVFAWHLARSNRMTARVLLGMTPQCAGRIAASTLKDLELLAELCPLWVAPRWETHSTVWRQLIQAAIDGRAAPLRRVQLRGLQLLAAGERRGD